MTGADHARLGDDAESLVTWIENSAFMRLAPLSPDAGAPEGLGRCGALVLDPVAGTFLCSVYARRPQVCRDLERGSGACRGELDVKRDRPRRALVVLT